MIQLCTVDWPALETLDVSGTPLDALCVRAMLQAHWPVLDTLLLSNTALNTAAVQQLVQGKWPKLRHLDILATRRWT